MQTIRTPDFCGCPIRTYGPPTNQCYSNVVLFMTLLEAYLNGRCNLADPCKRLPDSVPDESYDFVVVGGGTAGPVVAGKLAENPMWKVLVIEAGGDEPAPAAVPSLVTSYWGQEGIDWGYTTEPQDRACLAKNGSCTWLRGKVLGGCAVINGMMYIRGHAADYDNWASNGAEGWAWNDVLPYFLKLEDNKQIGSLVSERYHSRGGPVPIQQFRYTPPFVHDFISASLELGLPSSDDLNGANITGFVAAQATTDQGSRYSTARAYLRAHWYRQNVQVVYRAHATRVIVDPVNKKVTGVEFIKDGQTKVVNVKKEAIIAAGTMNSPQILMLSGIGPRETLEQFNITTIVDLPGVGQNLHNHVGVELQFTLTKNPDIPVLNWATASDYLLEREGPMSATGISQMTGILNSKLARADGQQPDIQFFFGGFSSTCGDGEIYTEDEAEDVDTPRTMSISTIAVQPRSRGYISIRSANPLDKPVMQPNYFSDEHELNVLIEAARLAFSFANTTIISEKYGMVRTPGFGDQCPGAENLTDDFLRCLIQQHTAPENHQVGTCKIGPATDPLAVVDKELKVHGVQGLRVVDASVMPVVTTAGTMPAVIMIGERAAEFIKSDYRPRISAKPSFGWERGLGPKRTRHWTDQLPWGRWNL